VLHDAPLGTYTGWNITAAGFYKGPHLQLHRRHDSVREDEAQRLASGDPRLSLEERYGSHAGTSRRFRRRRTTPSIRGFCSTLIAPL
jgi:hypothetical protein